MTETKGRLMHVGESDEGIASHYGFREDDQVPLLGEKNVGRVVKDKYHATFLIFYLLGLGGLLPWNFFINAQDYWMFKLGNCNSTMPAATVPYNLSVIYNIDAATTTPSGNSVTSLQSLFMNSLAVCAMLPGVIFQFLNTVFQKRISQNVRVIFSLIMMTALFTFTEILVKIDTCAWQETFFIITLISVVLINCFAAILQSSVFGLAAEFPQKYSGGYMAGQGMGGVFAAVAMLVALACSSGPSNSAFIFFLVAIAVLVLTIFGYILLTRLEFYKYSMLSYRDVANTSTASLLRTSTNHENLLSSRTTNENVNYAMDSGSYASLLQISKKMALHMFCVMYVFFITLTCFPAVTGKIKAKSSGTEWTEKYFEPVTCYLIFNLGDWLGRTTASYIHIPSSSSNWILLICVLARTAFPVLFAFCNYRPRYHLPVVIHEDWIYIIIMILFAVSNGHFTTLSMQYGPKQVEPENAATAGSMLGCMMSVGLLLGAGASFLLTSWI